MQGRVATVVIVVLFSDHGRPRLFTFSGQQDASEGRWDQSQVTAGAIQEAVATSEAVFGAVLKTA